MDQKAQVCGWCNVPIIGGSYTVLECKHAYHAKCAHGPMTKGAAHCILCKKDRVQTATDSEYRRLDFGDDWDLTNGRLAYEENSSLVKDIPGAVPLRVDLERVSVALSLREGGKNDGNGFFGRLESMTGVADALGIRHEADLSSLIKDRTPSGILVREKKIDAESLWRKGITLEHLMKSGYGLKDLVVLKTTWNDMLMLKFTGDVWRTYKKQLPVEEIIRIYRISIHDVMQMCGYYMLTVASIGFSIKELKMLGTTTQLLLEMYLDKESMIAFGFSMENWKAFGLTFDNLLQLQISKDDLYSNTRDGYPGLGWIDEEHRQAKLQRFQRTFGKTADLLTTTSMRGQGLLPDVAPNQQQPYQLTNNGQIQQQRAYPTLSTGAVRVPQHINGACAVIANSIAGNRPLTVAEQDAIYDETNGMFQGVTMVPLAQKTLSGALENVKHIIPENGWLNGPPRGMDPVIGPHAFFVVESQTMQPRTFLLTIGKPILNNVTPNFQNVAAYPTLS